MEARQQPTVIMVGADFDLSGDEAVAQAVRLAASTEDAVLHVSHVLDPEDVISEIGKPAFITEEEVLEKTPAVLRSRVEQIAREENVKLPPNRLHTHTRLGKAVETLLQMCVDYEVDLLVVGTHGRKGVERLLLGSVAEQVVRRARCPVLVAHAKDYSGCEKTPRPDAPYAAGEVPPYHKKGDRPLHDNEQLESWRPAGSDPTGIRIV